MRSLRLPLLIALVGVVVALACLVGFAQDAKAGATIDLIWRGDGDSTLDLTAGAVSSTITLDIFLKADESIGLVSISLEFDADGQNELNALSAFNWGGIQIQPGARFDPIGSPAIVTESGSGGPTGEIQSYSSGQNPTVPAPAGTYHIGTAVWHVTANLATDGPDIISGIFAAIDAIANGTDGDRVGPVSRRDRSEHLGAASHFPRAVTRATVNVLAGAVPRQPDLDSGARSNSVHR